MIGRSSAAVICIAALSASAEEVSLEKDLMPLFQRSCGTCHAPDSGIRGAIKGGTFFITKNDLLGKIGRSIVAGKPDESGLIKVLDQTVTFGKPRSGHASTESARRKVQRSRNRKGGCLDQGGCQR